VTRADVASPYFDGWDPVDSTEDLNLWKEWLAYGLSAGEQEARILDSLARDISSLDSGLLVIGRDVATGAGGCIDLLCLDAAGDAVIIDLRRNKIALHITLQVLDHGSWIADLSSEEVAFIARAYLGEGQLEGAFRRRFGVEIPVTLNSDHAMLVVGWHIDSDFDRMVRHLAGAPGVAINAVTIRSTYEQSGPWVVVSGSYLIEPSEVELHRCTPVASKECASLTEGPLGALADKAGVGELFRHSVASYFGVLRCWPTPRSIGFCWLQTGGQLRKTVVTLQPGRSNAEKGLLYGLNKGAVAELTGLPAEAVGALLPAIHEEPVRAEDTDPDRGTLWGYIRSRNEIDRLSAALTLRVRRA
jgi:hypothetical protein